MQILEYYFLRNGQRMHASCRIMVDANWTAISIMCKLCANCKLQTTKTNYYQLYSTTRLRA